MAKIAFKKLPVDMRDHLHELSGNELKVWLYFHLRTGADSTSYPSNETVAQATGLSTDTIKVCKASLRKKGWSARTKRRMNPDGTFGTVVEKTYLPWMKISTADEATVVEKTNHGTMVESSSAGKTHHKVDTEVPEVTVAAAPSPIQEIPEVQKQRKKERKTVPSADSGASLSSERGSESNQAVVAMPAKDLGALPQTPQREDFLSSPVPSSANDVAAQAPQVPLPPVPFAEHADEALFLMSQIIPAVGAMGEAAYDRGLAVCCEILDFLEDGYGYDLFWKPWESLLKWNRAHHALGTKEAGLYIRTPEQYLTALRSPKARLLNDWLADEGAKSCWICKKAELRSYEEERQAHDSARRQVEKNREERREAEERAEAEAAKQSRWKFYNFEEVTKEEQQALLPLRGEGWTQGIIGQMVSRREWNCYAVDAAIRTLIAGGQPMSFEDFKLMVRDATEAYSAGSEARARAAAASMLYYPNHDEVL